MRRGEERPSGERQPFDGRPLEADAAGAPRQPHFQQEARRSTARRRCVVDRLAWPSRSWIERRSAPPASRCVANECRSACGVACSGKPCRRRKSRNVRCATAASSRLPRAPRNSGLSGPAVRMQAQPRRHRLPHRRQHRHDALLAPLPTTRSSASRRRQRRVAHIQRQRLGDAQAAAVQQREQRGIARLDRGAVGHLADVRRSPPRACSRRQAPAAAASSRAASRAAPPPDCPRRAGAPESERSCAPPTDAAPASRCPRPPAASCASQARRSAARSAASAARSGSPPRCRVRNPRKPARSAP